MSLVILGPDRIPRVGSPCGIRVRTTKWLANCDISVGGSPIAAYRDGFDTWRIDYTFPPGSYAPVTIGAEGVVLGTLVSEVAGNISITPQLDLPAKSTGLVIPPAGAVTAWGDFATFSGMVISDGSQVTIGTTTVNGSGKTATGPVPRSHTLAWRGRPLETLWAISGLVLGRHTDISGGGCNIVLSGNGTTAAAGQVYNSANAYVAQTFGTYTVSQQSTLAVTRNADTGITSLYLNGALIGGAFQELDIDATTTDMTAALQFEGRHRSTFLGRWDRVFSVADAAAVHNMLVGAGL